MSNARMMGKAPHYIPGKWYPVTEEAKRATRTVPVTTSFKPVPREQHGLERLYVTQERGIAGAGFREADFFMVVVPPGDAAAPCFMRCKGCEEVFSIRAGAIVKGCPSCFCATVLAC